MRQECPEFFPEHASQGSLISSNEAETGLLWMWPGPRASSRVETGMSGNFLSCNKGVKDPLDFPEVRCDYPRDPSAEMGLIYPGGENLLDFLELHQVLSSYDGEVRDPLWWPQDWSVPMRDAQRPLRIHLPSMPEPKTLCGVVPGT